MYPPTCRIQIRPPTYQPNGHTPLASTQSLDLQTSTTPHVPYPGTETLHTHYEPTHKTDVSQPPRDPTRPTDQTDPVTVPTVPDLVRYCLLALTPSAPLALMPPPAMTPQGSTVSRLQMQLHLHELKQNATDLRKQLDQLRKMQLQNQESVRSLMKRTETELSVRVSDALRKQEDPLQRQRLLVEDERLKYLNEEELIIQQLHDLEKSVEEIQKESSVNHRHVTVQELEEKATVLRRLGETLTELKSESTVTSPTLPRSYTQFRAMSVCGYECHIAIPLHSVMPLLTQVTLGLLYWPVNDEICTRDQFPGLQSGCLFVGGCMGSEVFHRLCQTLQNHVCTLVKRQVNEGIWKSQDDFSSPSSKHMGGEDFRKGSDFDIPTSPPLNLNESSLANWSPHGHGHTHSHSHSNPSSGQRERDSHGIGSLKGRVLEELGGRGGSDKASSVEVRLAAERDWEEKRASLTQYSAQDINRLLEETQAELMKAIPDLDFAAKQIKPVQNQNQNQNPNQNQNQSQSEAPSSTHATPEHKPNKAQHVHKVSSKEGGSRRGSDELTVARYRTEKPSKSPPPPPPRRSFPSSPGLTTRSGEMIIPGKSMKKSESDETEVQKPHIKLRRSVSEAPRPASTPPTVAGGEREDGEEERVAAELEVESASQIEHRCIITANPQFTRPQGRLHERISETKLDTQAQRDPPPSSSSVPQIVLTECVSLPTSPTESSERGSFSDMEKLSKVPQRDQNTGNDITLSYFSHIVRTPSLLPWKQDLATSQNKRSEMQDLDGNQKEFQPRQRSSPAAPGTPSASPEGKAVKQPRKIELRIQESFEKDDTGEGDQSPGMPPQRRTMTEPNEPSKALRSASRTQGVGQEAVKEDIKRSTYRRLDSLEETIRELELSLMEFGTHPNMGHYPALPPDGCPTPSSPLESSGSVAPPSGPSVKSPGESQRPPVPPKPSISADLIKSGGGKAISRLKHLQQSGSEKSKLGKQREDFMKSQGQQQALGEPSASNHLLSNTRAASFSGRLPSGLRKYPQEGALSSSSQAKALLASLSATTSLSAEALLLSSTFRHHRLLREQRANSSATLPLPVSNGRSPTSPPSPTSPSSSPLTALNLSSLALKPLANRSLTQDVIKDEKDASKAVANSASSANVH
ncbi:hypothetical protein NFI96_021152 [Prochilodus magdalenae]|nr:hypothetical protein NFI96_021152 [Prochilodus magdalenae]